MTAPARYPVRTRILHWLTAVLVFSTLFIGFVMVNTTGSYESLRAVHMTLGVLILAIVVVRAANRFTHRVPKLPDTVGWLGCVVSHPAPPTLCCYERSIAQDTLRCNTFRENNRQDEAEKMNGCGPSSRSGRLLRLLGVSPSRREGHRGRRAETVCLRRGGTERAEGRC